MGSDGKKKIREAKIQEERRVQSKTGKKSYAEIKELLELNENEL